MFNRETALPMPVRVGVAIGYAAIFLGGLAAAVTAPLGFEKGSWLAAYLVLVAGLAQIFLSRQSDIVGLPSPPDRSLWAQLFLWVGGNTLVLLGAFFALPIIVDGGGIALIIALALALNFTRGARSSWSAWVLRLFYVAVIASVPVGLVLAHMRA